MVVLNGWIETAKIDIPTQLAFVEFAQEFDCIGSTSVKSVSWVKWFYNFLGEILSEFSEIFVFS